MQVRAPCVGRLQLPQPLQEISGGQAGEVVLRIGFDLDAPPRGSPLYIIDLLSQVAVVEPAESGGGAKLHRPMAAGLRFQPPASELLQTWWNRDPRRDFEGLQQSFAERAQARAQEFLGP
jgi:hypothetical protein